MTKKHYTAIADLVRRYIHPEAASLHWVFVLKLADFFEADNPNFDRGRFLAACGVKPSSEETIPQ